MPLVKELLLSCIVMNICLISSRPILQVDTLCQQMHNIDLSFRYLQKAEDDYVKLILGNQTLNLEPIEGITVGDNTKIEASVCAITQYFNNYLLDIVNNNTVNPDTDLISDNIKSFKHQFMHAVKLSKQGTKNTMPKAPPCSVSLPSSNYEKKITGFKIIYFTYKWVESFTSTETCNLQQ